jgi:plastocyanin
MNVFNRRGWRLRSACSSGLLGVLIAATTHAGSVTVTVKTRDGAAAADAIVVFDPLDAPPPRQTSAPVAIDQIKKQFVPLVTVVRTGTTIKFPNSDQIHHQVYSYSPAKPNFERDLYAGSTSAAEVFDKPGLVVLGCNIHDKMLAFVGVVDSPYFAKSSATGTASFDLPPGHYTVSAWHPELGNMRKRPVTVADAPANEVLVLDLPAGFDPQTAWPE